MEGASGQAQKRIDCGRGSAPSTPSGSPSPIVMGEELRRYPRSAIPAAISWFSAFTAALGPSA